MNTQQHEPLFNDDEILSLLTPIATIPPMQEPHRPLFQKQRIYIGAVVLAAASVATVFVINTADRHVEITANDSDVRLPVQTDTIVEANQAPLSKARIAEEKTVVSASPQELAELGITADPERLWFVEDGRRITISASGIGLRPTSETDLDRTPIAVTLYDDNGAYASWYNPSTGDPAMNDLVPFRVALRTAPTHLHQNVVALLWFAPRVAKLVEDQIGPYQEHRESAAGIRVENIYPNPVSGNEATLQISSTKETSASVSIMDVSGRLLATIAGVHMLSQGSTSVVLDGLQSLPPGMVLVVIDLPEIGSRLVQRLLIQR